MLHETRRDIFSIKVLTKSVDDNIRAFCIDCIYSFHNKKFNQTI